MRYSIDRLSRLSLRIDSFLLEEKERNNELRKFIYDYNNWEINNYESFLASVAKTPSKYKGFISEHPYEEISQPDWMTFKLKGYDAGFALHYLGDGKVDICNLHNNSELHGISDYMLGFAKSQGGTMLDNYAGFLGDKYGSNGFETYDKFTWDDAYRPEGWRGDLFGTPDVELRRDSKHEKRYNTDKKYKNKFDKKMNKKFGPLKMDKNELNNFILECVREIIRTIS